MNPIEPRTGPSHRELRWFAIGQAMAVAVLCFVTSGDFSLGLRWVALAASIGVLLVGILAPAVIHPVYVLWMKLVEPIGRLVSMVLLAVVFYFVITPIGIGLRLVGHDPLDRSRSAAKTTYWVARRLRSDANQYFRQF